MMRRVPAPNTRLNKVELQQAPHCAWSCCNVLGKPQERNSALYAPDPDGVARVIAIPIASRFGVRGAFSSVFS
jgi:hypothetical protein